MSFRRYEILLPTKYPETEAFFVQLKQALQERFRQIDIWIVSYEIRITQDYSQRPAPQQGSLME